jgi:inosose dehydratase
MRGPREIAAKPQTSWRYKVAGAPISWGVSELPEWGHRLTPERVLGEMASIGLVATELGPPGYLAPDATSRSRLLDRFGLRLVGGFLAAVMHDASRSPLGEIRREAAVLAASGAEVLVVAATLPGETYDAHRSLSATEWTQLGRRLREAAKAVAAHGMTLAFHPHAGTAVADARDVHRLLEATDVALCLDTGHLYLGGVEPAKLVRDAGGRVRHVHLKDVNVSVAERLRTDAITYAQAVREGLYTPLGAGGLDIDAIFSRLQEAGYAGWYVLEQDTALTAEPEPNAGPAVAARQSLDYFRRIAGAVHSNSASKEE